MRSRLSLHLRISGVGKIARRWFVTNAFDGNLTILGILLGSRALGEPNIAFVLGAGLGVCASLAISQSAGNIMTERAERMGELKCLERSMLRPLDNTVHDDASRTTPIVAGVVGGIAPAAYTFLSLIPYMLAWFDFLDAGSAFFASIGWILASVFVLGVFLGTISRTNLVISGLKMLGVGLLAVAVLLVMGAV